MPRLKSSKRLAMICLTALAVGWVIGGTGPLEAVERRIDYVRALIARHDAAARLIVLVQITQADFENPELFGGRRPLDAQVLRRMIERVAAQKPAVIAVDIDSGPAPFAALRALPASPPVVWVRAGRNSGDLTELWPVLGHGSVEAEGNRVKDAGIGLAIEDEHGTVRSYARRFRTPHGPQPSFTCAVLARCDPGSACGASLSGSVRAACREPGSGRSWRIDYRAASLRAWRNAAFSAGELLGASPDVLREAAPAFEDKIVVIGGTFAESGDSDHPTPIGNHNGIEIIAQILATEMRGGGANPGSAKATGVFVAFETYLILLVLAVPSWRHRLIGALMVVVGVAVLISLFNEHDLSRTGHYVTVLLFVLAIQAALRYVQHSQEMLVDWWRDHGPRWARAPRPPT